MRLFFGFHLLKHVYTDRGRGIETFRPSTISQTLEGDLQNCKCEIGETADFDFIEWTMDYIEMENQS